MSNCCMQNGSRLDVTIYHAFFVCLLERTILSQKWQLFFFFNPQDTILSRWLIVTHRCDFTLTQHRDGLRPRPAVTQVTHRRRTAASRVGYWQIPNARTAAIKFSSLIGHRARFSALSWVSRRHTGEWEKVFFPGQAKIYPVPLKWRAK